MDEIEGLEPSCNYPGLPRGQIFQGDYSFNTGKVKGFEAGDYVFFVITLAVSTAIGFYQGWRSLRKMSAEEYFTASHSMHAFPVSLSLLASFFSGVTLISTPVEVYSYSTMNFWAGTNYLIGIGTAAYIFIPVFYQLKTVSSFEYLEMRFSRGIRTLCSSMYLCYMIAYLSFCLSAPSVTVSAVTGFDLYWSSMTIGIVCTIYTAVGGMKAVIWTDTFQIVVSLIGVLVLLIRSMIVIGGPGVAWDAASRTGRIKFNDFRTDPAAGSTFWSIVIGSSTIFLSYGVNQSQVMRSQACRTLKEAKRAVLGNIPGLCLFFYMSCFIGLYMTAFYENCDPVKAKFVPHSSQISSLYMMDMLGDTAGLPGLFLAGVVSATLSSTSSGLNSIAAVILEDYVKVYFRSHIRKDHAQLLSQAVSIFFGLILLETTYLVSGALYLRMAALSAISLMTAPITGVFILGILIPQTNLFGAWAGLLGSIIIEFWIYFGKKYGPPFPWPKKAITCVSNCQIANFPNATVTAMLQKFPPRPPFVPETSIYHISWQWDATIAVTSCVVIGVIVTFITGKQDPNKTDPRLIVPLLDEVWPFYYLAEETREFFRFGIVHEGKFDTPPDRKTITSYQSQERQSASALNSPAVRDDSKQISAEPTPNSSDTGL